MSVNGVINEQSNKTLKNIVQISLTEKIKSRKGAFLGIFEFLFLCQLLLEMCLLMLVLWQIMWCRCTHFYNW